MAFTIQTGEIKFKNQNSVNPEFESALNIFTDMEAAKITDNYFDDLEDKKQEIIDELNSYVTLAETYANSAQQSASQAMRSTDEGYVNLVASIAPEYNALSTYTIGSYVLKNSSFYRCIQAINIAEAWTSGHWSQTTIGEEITNCYNLMSSLYGAMVNNITNILNITPELYGSSGNNDLDITDENGNVLVRFSGGHIYTKNFYSDTIQSDYKMIYTTSATNTDLDIADDSGNVLVRMKNGHIETKKFNSVEVPKNLNDTNSSADLDISDETGNVLVSMKNGHIETKNFDSAKTDLVLTTIESSDFDIADQDGNIILRLEDGEIKTKNFDSGWIDKPIYIGVPADKEILFTNNDVSEGELISYSFIAKTSGTGAYIDILDINNVRITYIGRTSSGVDTKYSGIYTIPHGFGKAVARNNLKINIISTIQRYINMMMLSVSETTRKYIENHSYSIENRLANPLYETYEHYNSEHSSAPIIAENALTPGITGPAGYRIPSVIITNAGTVLVAGTHMTNAGGDYGDFSIDVARKPNNGNWNISEVVPFDTTRENYGSVLNNEFFVDRNTGRIYLFFGTEKQYEIWWDVNSENGDFRYVYSDDDGITWSNQISLKSLWDTSVYDYCIPSCTKGIMLTNGTYVIPCFCKKSYSGYNLSWPLLLIKPNGGDWYFSSVAIADGVNHLDECAVVEGLTANEIWLYCRPNTDYGTGPNRGYNKFVYSISDDYFFHKECTFDGNRHNCFSIDKLIVEGTSYYLMTFTDTNTSLREKITLWASLDGDIWIRVYRIYKPSGNGYSVIDNYNNKIVVAYEASSNIACQDISVLKTLIVNSTNMIGKNMSVQDRMQIIYNNLAGIN